MTDFTFTAVATTVIFVGIVAWVVLTHRSTVRIRRVLWVLVAGLAIIALLLAMRLALPEAIRGPAVTIIGLALSGVAVLVGIRYRERLPPGQSRQMIGLAIVGAVLTVLGVVAEMTRPGR